VGTSDSIDEQDAPDTGDALNTPAATAALVDGLDALAADGTTTPASAARYATLVAQWEARLAAENRRELDRMRQIAGLRRDLAEAERANCVLLDKLRRWKAWFSEALLAKRTLDLVRRQPAVPVAVALPRAEAEAQRTLAARLGIEDADVG
jgi:hypothetical protein